MRRDALPASWFRPLLLPLLGVLGAADLANAQSERLQRVVQQAIAALGDPRTAADGATRLENLGSAAVPALREAVAYGNRERFTEAQRLQAMYVLGRLGAKALPALSELRDYACTADGELGRQAMWALSMLVPHLPVDLLKELSTEQRVAAGRRSFHAAVLQVQISLGIELAFGNQSGAAVLQGYLDRSSDNDAIAASRWLIAHPDAHPEQRPQLLAVLANRLDRDARRDAVRWRGPLPGNEASGEVAEAWLAVSREGLAALPARALLHHWHVDRRRAAIAWMHDHGASLPFREFADLVGRLWDGEPALVAAAAAACGNAKDKALVALPALRAMERDADPTARRACGAAADAIVAALATWPDADRAWIGAIDGVLRGQPTNAPGMPCGQQGLARLAEVLWLAQWNGAPMLAGVLDLVERAGPVRDDAVQAVLGWLDRDDVAVTDVACAFLARRGAAVQVALDGTDERPDAVLRRAVCVRVPHEGLCAGIELLAHATVSNAAPADFAILLDDNNTRIVAHALAVALTRPGGALRNEAARLRSLLQSTAEPWLVLGVTSQHFTHRRPIDLSNQVRTLAAIALVDLDEELPPAPGLDEAVQATLGIGLADLDRHVAEARTNKNLHTLLTRIEDQCRHAMGIAPHLRWPGKRPVDPSGNDFGRRQHGRDDEDRRREVARVDRGAGEERVGGA
ncbi:MAG: hypothetical protein WAT39_06820, partial [Planctomycetota bacterium]